MQKKYNLEIYLRQLNSLKAKSFLRVNMKNNLESNYRFNFLNSKYMDLLHVTMSTITLLKLSWSLFQG